MEESRYVCKLCNKKFPCGKSLGGHMRSHVVAAANEARIEHNLKRISYGSRQQVTTHPHPLEAYVNMQSGYGLRENPRKTWRAVDSQEGVCKKCGKGFQSLKALCGHMACHSNKDRTSFKDDHSWTSENQKQVVDSHSYTEFEEFEDRTLKTRSCKIKSSKKVIDESHFSSSVSEIDGQDQEEVAMCLMLLSMDSGNKNGVNSVVESSDNNSVVMETKSSSNEMRLVKREDMKLKDISTFDEIIHHMESSDSGYFLEECTKAESDASFNGFGRFHECKKPATLWRGEEYGTAEVRKSLRLIKSKGNEYDEDGFGGVESRKRKYTCESSELDNKKSKYECFNCKKTFKSYQALGGHRPCHKRTITNASYESSSLDETNQHVEPKMLSSNDKKMKPKNNKGHVCPFCNRVFKNGQALGGHKRSHFISGRVASNNRSSIVKPDLLDLNLPAPEVGNNEEGGKFFPW